MAYLVEFAMDNVGRLDRTTYLFEYEGVGFKLVQDNPRQWADHLMAVLPEGTPEHRQRAYEGASLFVAALGWQNQVPTAVWETGGGGWRDEWHLRRARPTHFTFPRIPFHGYQVGCLLNVLPKVETDQQRLALTLFREAHASNSDYLSLLFYWQVLGVAGNPQEVANGLIANRERQGYRGYVPGRELSELPLRGRSLGEYLQDDCRNAIAHVIRSPRRQAIELENLEDRVRISRSTRVAKALASACITSELRMTKEVYLVRTSRSGLPVYCDPEEAGGLLELAYSRRYPPGYFPSPRGGRPRRTRRGL